ncbi:MAG: tyrosine-type recombinase/integrase [Coprococcus phoceensis]
MKIIWDIFGSMCRGSDIADIPLEKLSTSALQKFYNMKLKGTAQRKQLSRRTVEYLHTIIGSALEQAYKNEMIAKNVNEFTVLPKKEEKEIEPLTIEDLEKVLRVAKETDLYSLILLEVFTGMRKGEILGLQWENVDLEKKVLWVRKNLCRVENNDEEDGRKTKLILLEPKTKKSIREIPLSEEAVRVLKIHKRKQNEQKMLYRDIYQDNGVVFAKADGSFEDPREVLRRFHKILKKAGVRKCRFHDLRHTFASILINEGESMKVIQELLGHSTITTTMDIYSHVTKETKKRSIEILERTVGTKIS